jgi:hypothetical protein
MSFPHACEGGELGVAGLNRLFEQAPAPMALALADEGLPTIHTANDAFLDLVGGSRARLGGVRLDKAFRATASTQIRQACALALAHDETVRLRIAHARGYDVVRLELELKPLALEDRRYLLLSAAAEAAEHPGGVGRVRSSGGDVGDEPGAHLHPRRAAQGPAPFPPSRR